MNEKDIESLNDEDILNTYNNMFEEYTKSVIFLEKIIEIMSEKEKKINIIKDLLIKRNLMEEKDE